MQLKNRIIEALIELHEFLREENIQFMVIGGIANLIWGQPRLTQDIDITISVEDIPSFIKKIRSFGKLLPENPIKFAEKTRVSPIEINNVKVDIIFAGTEYERIAISRVIKVEIQKGININVCSPEDLIIHKAISERERDWEDIEGIILRQGKRLDKKYISKWLKAFSSALARPDILTQFNALWRDLTMRKND